MKINLRYSKLSQKTKRTIKSIARSEMVLLAAVVGAITAIFSLAFRFSIVHISTSITNFVSIDMQHLLFLPFITALGGLIGGYIIHKVAQEAKGSGIPLVKARLLSTNISIRIRSVFAKFLAGIAGIGSGLSLGLEGPSVHLGAGAGCLIARFLKLQPAKRNKLVAAGAGAAIAATFNAPIASTIFVIEELVHIFASPFLFPILIATVTASTIVRAVLGSNPAFSIVDSKIPIDMSNISVFIILGIVAGLLGVLFNKQIVYFLTKFSKMNIASYWKVAAAGFFTGCIGMFLPYIMGSGSIAIGELFTAKMTFGLIIAVFIGKFFLTALCFGSGAAGGLFMPTLTLGSLSGYALGMMANTLGVAVDPITVGLVGMGAFLAAVVRTPLTAVVIVFELTADYNHILPIILSAAIADIIADKLQSPSIYTTLMNKRYLKQRYYKKLIADKVKT